MSILSGRMKPDELARAKSVGPKTAELNALADIANGASGTRADQERAAEALVAKAGSKRAKQLLEEAAVRNGAKPGLWRRLRG